MNELCVDMLAEEKKLQNILVRTLEGAIYTVDEVSGLLGIPRPTLYRYLREYSIPHLRREGRISIPEDSFDRIREARDLHKEGLGTESVRRQLREDPGGLESKLDNLHQSLESLRGDIRGRTATDEAAPSPALRTILARQSLLMSATFNLTQIVEDLMPASRKPRRRFPEDSEIGYALPEKQARDRLMIPAGLPSTTPAVTATVRGGAGGQLAARPTDFGALGRRRRRGVLAILATLLLAACLAWAVWASTGADDDESSVPRVTETANEPPGRPKAVAGPRERFPGEAGPAGRTNGAGVITGGSRPERAIEVPDVSGKSLEGAVRIISDAGFEVAAIKTRASQRSPGKALRTKPPADAYAKPGAPLILTMGGPIGASSSASATATASVSASASASASAGYAN
jgi:excisionase family DNA binding protein